VKGCERSAREMPAAVAAAEDVAAQLWQRWRLRGAEAQQAKANEKRSAAHCVFSLEGCARQIVAREGQKPRNRGLFAQEYVHE